MKSHLKTYIVFLLLCCASCKSLQKSTASRTGSKSAFIDGVTIKPGENKAGNYTPAKEDNRRITTINSPSDIEKVNWLQIKYAILLDMPVEDITDSHLIEVMDHWWGTHYCLGGNNEQCIDCSGFTKIFLKDVFGIDIPRVASEQYKGSERIQSNKLKEGDLVFFRTGGRGISHVGVYLCNNKFVHASVSSGVMISSLTENYWSRRYVGAGRNTASSPTSSNRGDFGVR